MSDHWTNNECDQISNHMIVKYTVAYLLVQVIPLDIAVPLIRWSGLMIIYLLLSLLMTKSEWGPCLFNKEEHLSIKCTISPRLTSVWVLYQKDKHQSESYTIRNISLSPILKE